MAINQPGIFQEGHDHHQLLELELRGEPREPGAADALRSALREPAAAARRAQDPSVVLALSRRALELLAPGWAPSELEDFGAIEGAGDRSAPTTQRDVLIWVHGTARDECFRRALEAGRALDAAASAALDLAGFRYLDSRDLTGFIDGSANPRGEAAREAALVPSGPAAGGSFVLGQQWVHDLSRWNALPDAEQEKIIGRTKPDSVELTGDNMPPDSHVSRTDVKVDGEAMKLWRRSFPYGTVGRHGLYFLAFARSPRRFQVLLERMFGVADDGLHDRLVEYTRPVTGSYWFAPPAEWLAEALG